MYLLIDNKDSFVYNLSSCIKEYKKEVIIIRNDKLDKKVIEKIITDNKIKGIIISPGPGSPKDNPEVIELIKDYKEKLPILGVCLGHQMIAYAFGYKIKKNHFPKHGKVENIVHDKKNLFFNIDSPMQITRYHSLIVDDNKIEDNFIVNSRSDDDAIMAITHKEYRIYGIQFHPEAVLTLEGKTIIKNFIDVCENVIQKTYTYKIENINTLCEIAKAMFNVKEEFVFLDTTLLDKENKYSILGMSCDTKISNKNGKTYINDIETDGEFEDILDEKLKINKEVNHTKLPFINGGLGYFSYDYGMKFENIVSRHKKNDEVDEAAVYFFRYYLIEDKEKNEVFLATQQNIKDFYNYLKDILNSKINKTIKHINKKEKSLFEKNDYIEAIRKTINHIIEGDVYIMNLTRTIKTASSTNPFEMYEFLSKNNPFPYGGFINTKDFSIISSSPERFIKVKDKFIETCPIKGTRKRGKDKKEDEVLKNELINSAKDKSELLMIVDLERNDMNRICKSGSVKVKELYKLKTYSTVYHLVANIVGELEKDISFSDILKAMFPGGSITGAPKIRAMEIIDELEKNNRGIYTGSMGYIGYDESIDLNILIRTAVYKDGIYSVGVGGGITCESEEEFEYEETTQKFLALKDAIMNYDN